GADPFPLFLKQGSPVSVTCVIRWKPLSTYDSLIAEQTAATPATKAAVTGRIKLAWPDHSEWNVEKPIAPLAAETIRELKPGDERYCFYDDSSTSTGDESVSAEADAMFTVAQPTTSFPLGIELLSMPNAAAPVVFVRPAREANDRYAKRGEIAS